MISKESLKLSVYDYFKYCHTNKEIRGIGLITDKQSIFYSQIEDGDYRAHEWVASDLEDTIHPNEKKEGWDKIRGENMHFFSMGWELIVDLPLSDTITISQYDFLVEVLNQVKKYNEEYPQYKIWILISTDSEYLRNHSRFDIDDIIQKLKNLIKKDNQNIYEERIIGKVRSNKEIINNIIFTIDLESVKTIEDLKKRFYIIEKYYNDNYYHKYIIEIFPNYLEIEFLCRLISCLDEEINFDNLTIDNFKEKLELIVKNIFVNRNFHEIFNILNTIILLKYKTDFKEIDYLFSIMNKIYFVSDINNINNLLKNTNSYEDVFNVILSYYRKMLENNIEKYKEFLESNNYAINNCYKYKIIKTNIDELEQLILMRNELIDLKNDVINALIPLEVKYKYIDSNSPIRSSLESKINLLKTKRDCLQDKIFNIENKFCSFGGLQVFEMNMEYLRNTEKFDIYNEDELKEQELNLRRTISELEQELEKINSLIVKKDNIKK